MANLETLPSQIQVPRFNFEPVPITYHPVSPPINTAALSRAAAFQNIASGLNQDLQQTLAQKRYKDELAIKQQQAQLAQNEFDLKKKQLNPDTVGSEGEKNAAEAAMLRARGDYYKKGGTPGLIESDNFLNSVPTPDMGNGSISPNPNPSASTSLTPPMPVADASFTTPGENSIPLMDVDPTAPSSVSSIAQVNRPVIPDSPAVPSISPDPTIPSLTPTPAPLAVNPDPTATANSSVPAVIPGLAEAIAQPDQSRPAGMPFKDNQPNSSNITPSAVAPGISPNPDPNAAPFDPSLPVKLPLATRDPNTGIISDPNIGSTYNPLTGEKTLREADGTTVAARPGEKMRVIKTKTPIGFENPEDVDADAIAHGQQPPTKIQDPITKLWRAKEETPIPKLNTQQSQLIAKANSQGAGITMSGKTGEDAASEAQAFLLKSGILTKEQQDSAERIAQHYESGQEYKDAEAVNRLANNFRSTYSSGQKDGPSDIVLTDIFSKIASNPTGRLSAAAVNMTKSTIPLLQKFLNPDGSINTDFIKTKYGNGAFLPQETKDAMARVVDTVSKESENSFLQGPHFQMYQKLAQKSGLDPNDWVQSPFTHPTAPAVAAQATAPSTQATAVPMIDPNDPSKKRYAVPADQVDAWKKKGAIMAP